MTGLYWALRPTGKDAEPLVRKESIAANPECGLDAAWSLTTDLRLTCITPNKR